MYILFTGIWKKRILLPQVHIFESKIFYIKTLHIPDIVVPIIFLDWVFEIPVHAFIFQQKPHIDRQKTHLFTTSHVRHGHVGYNHIKISRFASKSDGLVKSRKLQNRYQSFQYVTVEKILKSDFLRVHQIWIGLGGLRSLIALLDFDTDFE